MKTLLLPIDFSEGSDKAINYAVEMAKLTKSKLILFHTYHVPVITTDVPMLIPSMEELGEDSMKALRKKENEIYLSHGTGLQVECVCRCGLEVDELEEYSTNNDIDLIITSMEEAGELTEKLIGSVTTSLMRTMKCPVLAVGKNFVFRDIKKIALACDFKGIKTAAALEPLKEIVKFFNAHLFIVNVLKEQKELIPTTEQAVSGVQLDHMLEEINHSFHYEENVNVVDGINHFVDQHNIDLLVMIPRSHTLLQEIFHEPNTKRMAFHSHVPLLSIHE
ncbi:MAG: universal stress protein [Bacteroidetes bacterium]|nr:universal stress protein [Bacteroidota bacterium]